MPSAAAVTKAIKVLRGMALSGKHALNGTA
jgi:hypothetical protein